MKRVIAQLIGGFFVVFGLIGILSPIPFGLFFLVIGFLLLIPTSPLAVKIIKNNRRRFRFFNNLMDKVTHKLPYPYRAILRETAVD